MNKTFKKDTSFLVVFAILISGLTSMPISVSAETLSFNYDSYKVDYNITSSWGNNQNINIILTNTGSEPILNWALRYDPCGTITGIWNGETYGENIVKNAYYNADIAAGASVTLGYNLTGVTGSPSGFALCSYRAEKTDGYTVGLSVQNDWNTGFTGLIRSSPISVGNAKCVTP